MKLPRRQFLHLAAGAAALPAVSRIRMGASLSDAAGAHRRRLCRRRRGRHPRAPDGSMAVGAARPAIRHREPAGRRQQYRHRGGRARARRTATRSSWSTPANAINATLYDKLNFNFIRDIAPVAGIMRVPARHGGESIGSGQDRSRIHRLCQGQSGQDQHGVGRQRGRRPCGRRTVQDDGRRRHGACALSRRGARAHRSARRTGAGSCSPASPASIEHIRAGKLRALAVTTATRSEVLPDIPTVGEFVPGYEASSWYGIGAPRNTPAEIVDRLNKEINAGLADPKIKARLADLGGTVLAGLARRLRQAHRRRNREVGQGDQVRGHQGGVIRGSSWSSALPQRGRDVAAVDGGHVAGHRPVR